jgi:hypothetical protein
LLARKWEELKMCFPSPSIGHQAWNLSLVTKHETFHWPPNTEPSLGHQALDLPSPPFSFSLKSGLRSLRAFSFPRHNFQFNLEYLFPQVYWGGKEWLVLRNGKKKEVKWKSCNSFGGLAVSSDNIKKLEL